jgi:hypothetical protein
MKQRFLEVTFRKGRPLAAYLNLQRKPGDTSTLTERLPTGLLIDYAVDGRPIGTEMPSPAKVTLAAVNQALGALKHPVTPDDIAPLLTLHQKAS